MPFEDGPMRDQLVAGHDAKPPVAKGALNHVNVVINKTAEVAFLV